MRPTALAGAPAASKRGSSRGAAILAFFLCFFPSILLGQTDLSTQEPFSTWNATAGEAQEILQDKRASIEDLERIRSELSEQRDLAFERSQEVSIPARAIEAQLEALGAPPPDGATESEEVAAERADLIEQLARENAPTVAARQAFDRAELLVGEIDTRIRASQTEVLLRRLPSPLAPGNWTGLPGEISSRTADFASDVAVVAKEEVTSGRAWRSAPLAAGLAIAGFALIVLVAPWMVRKLAEIRRREISASRRRMLSLGSFLAQFAVPVLGLALLFVSPLVLNLQMERGQELIDALPALIAMLVVAHLVGSWVFGARAAGDRLFNVDGDLATKGYRLSLTLGVFLALESFLVTSETVYGFSPATRSVLSFLVILVGVVPLWQLGRLLRKIKNASDTGAQSPGLYTEQAPSFASDVRWLIAWLLQISAVLALAGAALGYVNFSRQAIAPMVVTLAVIGVAIHLKSLLVGLLRDALGETTEDEAEGGFLVSVLVSLALVCAVIPLLALVWGARTTDIAEVWRLLTDGVELGETRISLTTVFTLAIVFVLGLGITRWVQRLFRRSLLPRTNLDRGAQSSIVTGMGYIGLVITALIAVSTAGINLSSLAVVFGALSVGIGFGLQNIVSNFVSGIILLVERPVKEGDWIEVSGYSGFVKKIAVRSTRIETFDRFDVIVPNTDLIAGTVKNMTLSSTDGRVILPVGVAYGSDVEKVREILFASVEGDDRVMADPPPMVLFVGLGDSSIDFELRFYLSDVMTTMVAKSDVLFRVYAALNEAGIEIPFPQRDVNLKGLESVVAAMEKR